MMATVDVPDTGYYEYLPLVLKNELVTRLPSDVVVATQVPEVLPPRLVVLLSVPANGDMNLVLSTRRCIIECRDRSELLTGRLAEKVRGFLVDAMYRPGNGIRDVNVIGEPAIFTNPDDPSNTPRATLTVDVLLRATYAL
jgi:hypothetical protein